MRITAAASVAAAAALALAACGGTEPAGGAEPPPPPAGQPAEPVAMTIAEALEAPAGTPVVVEGFVVAADGSPAHLCSSLAESYPPQCGGPSLVVEGLDLESVEGLRRAEEPEYAHTAWTDSPVALTGEVSDGVLRVAVA
jgi:hypothetical protein